MHFRTAFDKAGQNAECVVLPYLPEYKSHRAISRTPKIGAGFSISLFRILEGKRFATYKL